mmetsp:Transcript_23201/g.34249  ORF Transcript_23201/g.34249 Transcript_23201/m.34249 type:complete len:571 (+) Transcript_23201:80-1792(+)|eukprot:CAMPEP_0194210360 /NCGR_PEP_ID=MMETSP0156-20130528/8175_1 /TAXON_ID=33649 /ORGANISM="Thalassionema nitzschioides, Strain L26-B" /LENGTH=570 /DNA_ID=CAMNT_0038937691 /DNA_START=49 /DNA_END=1761 /DNA_ORIENTATION=-
MEAPTTSPPINFANYPLRDIPAPHSHDVLCGRGGGTNNHVGNSHWRMLVAANKQLYVTLPKRQKMLLSRSIVNAVRSQNPPGRFLQKDGKSDLWYDVGDQRAQEKTSQALREGAPNIRGTGNNKLDGETPATKDSTEKDTKEKPDTTKPLPNPNLPISAPVPEKTTVNPTNMMHQGQNNPFNNTQAPNIPPGSTPVMVYAMPQGGVPAMYPAMVTPDGMMVPTMQGTAPPSLPPPIPSQLPTGESGKSTDKFLQQNNAMPPPSNLTDPSTSSLAEIGAQSYETTPHSNRTQDYSDSQIPLHGNGQHYYKEFDETVDMVGGGLEPTGISFGSISMNSVSGKLEPAGTSFGSMMSFTVGSKAPEPIDGGLEPIGTSFGSLSLNSVEQSNLQRALNSDGQDTRIADAKDDSDAIPTLLSQQKSMGNLLECSDTESEPDEEEQALKQASKSAEWEKLKAILEAHTNMDNIEASQPPAPYRSQNVPCEETRFDRDFSNVSAMSMGEFEDFDNLAPLPQKNESSHEYDANISSGMAPPPPMPIHKENDDDDSISSRERLQLMYLEQTGADIEYSRT